MAGKRVIGSDVHEHQFIGSLTFFERLQWIGIITAVADDQGRFVDNPAIVRAKVFLYDHNITDDKVAKALVKYSQAGKLERYTVNGIALAQIIDWWHGSPWSQSPSWAIPSKYPAPTGWVDRAKHHVGKNVVMENWDNSGGYSEIPIKIPIEIPIPIKQEQDKGKDKRSSSKKRDPLLDHPAIVAYREIVRYHVPIVWRQRVVDAVGEKAEEWRSLVDTWVGKGWNPRNVQGMVEAFEAGGIAPKKGKSSEPAGFAALRAAKEGDYG